MVGSGAFDGTQLMEDGRMSTSELESSVLAGLGIAREAPGMAPGIELRLALEQDDLFGPVIAFSYGAMAMDVWDDATYRVVPLAPRDARRMVHEPRAARRLLGGYREAPPPDVARIEAAILRLSDYAREHPEFAEIELEPLIARPDGLYARGIRVAATAN